MTGQFPPSDPQGINADILAAHAADDGVALVKHYTRIADEAEHRSDKDACCFFLTQAYVFALQHGLDEHHVLQLRLQAYGRL